MRRASLFRFDFSGPAPAINKPTPAILAALNQGRHTFFSGQPAEINVFFPCIIIRQPVFDINIIWDISNFITIQSPLFEFTSVKQAWDNKSVDIRGIYPCDVVNVAFQHYQSTQRQTVLDASMKQNIVEPGRLYTFHICRRGSSSGNSGMLFSGHAMSLPQESRSFLFLKESTGKYA